MKRLFSSRFLLISVILVIGVVLLVQNMGIAGPHPPLKPSAIDSTAAASPPPQLDWALAGLVVSGALITLLRPRRRKTVPVPTK